MKKSVCRFFKKHSGIVKECAFAALIFVGCSTMGFVSHQVWSSVSANMFWNVTTGFVG
ncbi:hypothetical protein HN954_03465 [bacterium]|jgi:hypothetical protein|nr:hypothetical protein [bacterium]MBT6832236.1 hypothetical protein [bacterium]MBT6996461.1 hypothetical protein [bacterium]MBT7772292.1 hypothetical protein [bacterium]